MYCDVYHLFLRSSLQTVRDAVSNQVSAVFQLYEQNRDSLDLLCVTKRSATNPSIADMMEWLQDAERHYQQQYPLCSCQQSLVLRVLFPSYLMCSDF